MYVSGIPLARTLYLAGTRDNRFTYWILAFGSAHPTLIRMRLSLECFTMRIGNHSNDRFATMICYLMEITMAKVVNVKCL